MIYKFYASFYIYHLYIPKTNNVNKKFLSDSPKNIYMKQESSNTFYKRPSHTLTNIHEAKEHSTNNSFLYEEKQASKLQMI